jgi:3-oxoacyl-[acyl-carrier-protein] synthase III
LLRCSICMVVAVKEGAKGGRLTIQYGIIGVGHYVPKARIGAAEIAAKTGIPEAVLIERFGIVEKPVPGPDDHTHAMAVHAAQAAVADAGIDPKEIDVVLATTEEWKEYPLWTTAIALAHDLGATRAWGMDVQARCGTTIAALKLAEGLMAADDAVRTVLIAGGYRNGDFVDYGNARARFLINLSCGGGALLLQRDANKNLVLSSHVLCDGAFSRDVIVPAGGTVLPATAEMQLGKAPYALDVPDPEGMKGRLDELSMKNFVGVIDHALAKAGRARSEIGYLNILHMKKSAHDYVLRELGVPAEKSVYLDHYGHIGQQDQPLSIQLARAQNKLRDGDLMVMVAAGIGYIWTAACVAWGPARA